MAYTLHADLPVRRLIDLYGDRLPAREYRTFRGAEQAARMAHRKFDGMVIDILELASRPTPPRGGWAAPVKVADVSTDALGRRWTTLTGQGSLSL